MIADQPDPLRPDILSGEMRALWDTLIDPLLDACDPSVIVEFNGDDDSLVDLLDEAATDRSSTVIRGSEAESGEIAGPEFALVHGEPNWYSVTERLDRLAEMAAAGDAPFPLTLVHCVDWPTGRRDAYPKLESIPLGARQPHGPDGDVERALDAHDQRNGVLTAVEDFLAGRGDDIELLHIPGMGGAAILVSQRRLKGKGSRALVKIVKGLRLSHEALAQIAAIEADRQRALAHAEELVDELEAARAGVAVQSSAEQDLLRVRLRELAARQVELKEALARRNAKLVSLEANGSGPVPRLDPARDEDDTSRPQPLDRRQILVGEGEVAASDLEPVDAVLRMTGEAQQLRLCIWSLLSRSNRPLRLTLTTDPAKPDTSLELAREVAAAEPNVRVSEGEPEIGTDAWRLRIDAPVVFAHGAVDNLLAAAGRGSPRPVAATSAAGFDVPPWAGPDSLALLLSGRTLAIDSASQLAAQCVALPPGFDPGPPAEIALDAVMEAGGSAESLGAPADFDWLAEAYRDEGALSAALRERLENPLSVAYVLPGLPAEGSGGSH